MVRIPGCDGMRFVQIEKINIKKSKLAFGGIGNGFSGQNVNSSEAENELWLTRIGITLKVQYFQKFTRRHSWPSAKVFSATLQRLKPQAMLMMW